MNFFSGVHAATYLWSSDLPNSIQKASVKAVILISVPMHVRNLKGFALEGAESYYEGKMDSHCPYTLRKMSSDRTETLLLTAERDPEMDILEPVRETEAFLIL